MPDDVGLHRSEAAVTEVGRALVEEVGDADAAVLGPAHGAVEEALDNVHVADDYAVLAWISPIPTDNAEPAGGLRQLLTVVERNNLCVADLPARVHRAKRRQAREHRLGELMPRRLGDDVLELIRADVPIAVLVEEVESLTETLPLEALDELGELRVVERVPVTTLAKVQLAPVAVEVECCGSVRGFKRKVGRQLPVGSRNTHGCRCP